MRTVVPTDEVARLWADRSQDHARNARGNVYFHGDTIYSYGPHFPLARHVDRRGGHLVLINSHRYSVTTGRHQSCVSWAVRDMNHLRVPDLFPERQNNYGGYYNKPRGHRVNLDWFAELIALTAKRLERSRTYTRCLLGDLDRQIGCGNSYAEFFGLRTRFRRPAWVDEGELLERAVYWETWRDKLAEARREAAQAARKKFIEAYKAKVKLWRDGAQIDLPEMPYELRDVEGIALRLRWPYVQASIGVDASVADVVALLELVRAGRDKEWDYAWVDGGYVDLSSAAPRFPPYRVTKVHEDGRVSLSSGHFIAGDEVERIGVLLGLWPKKTEPPDWYVEMLNNIPVAGGSGRSLRRRRRTIRLYEEDQP